MIIAKPVLSILAASVTSWPREGVVLLIIIVVLLAIAAVWANLRGGAAPADQGLDLIAAPPGEGAASEEAEDRELQEIYDV